MAKEAQVSERTIEQAKSAHAAGLGEAVRTGKLSAKDAADLTREQRRSLIDAELKRRSVAE